MSAEPLSRPLAGLHVVVTRPRDQALALTEGLRSLGADPVLFPLLAIGPVADARGLDAACRDLDRYDLAFFVSPNAVSHALDVILARRAWPAHVAVATVGPGSAQALAARGFDGVIAPLQGFDSEAVMGLPAFAPEAVRGKRIVIFRGDGGRELLAQYLRAHGAEPVVVTAYHRYCPASDPSVLFELAAQAQLDAMTLTSSEALRNLASLLGLDGCARLRDVPLFVSHPRIGAAAREAGFKRLIECRPGDAGLLSAVELFFAR